jgi:3-methyladenine DNA glycosylase AlkD
MHVHHKSLLTELKKHQRKRTHSQANDSYLSSGHIYYDVSVPARRAIAKAWLKENKAIAPKQYEALLKSLVLGKSHEEKTLASLLLAGNRQGRASIGPQQLDHWLNHLVGWAEIDSFCQNVFTAEEMLGDWPAWERFLRKLAKDKNINKRRASLVFLTRPVHTSKDQRFAALAFENIERLKHEREIIITKAVSWLLRCMTTHHKRMVTDYIAAKRETLPAVAVRETLRKVRTGRK